MAEPQQVTGQGHGFARTLTGLNHSLLGCPHRKPSARSVRSRAARKRLRPRRVTCPRPATWQVAPKSPATPGAVHRSGPRAATSGRARSGLGGGGGWGGVWGGVGGGLSQTKTGSTLFYDSQGFRPFPFQSIWLRPKGNQKVESSAAVRITSPRSPRGAPGWAPRCPPRAWAACRLARGHQSQPRALGGEWLEWLVEWPRPKYSLGRMRAHASCASAHHLPMVAVETNWSGS